MLNANPSNIYYFHFKQKRQWHTKYQLYRVCVYFIHRNANGFSNFGGSTAQYATCTHVYSTVQGDANKVRLFTMWLFKPKT